MAPGAWRPHFAPLGKGKTMKFDLRKITLFSKLPDQMLADVEAKLKKRRLQAGEVLFNQGDPGDELIIVEDGVIAIYVPSPKDPKAGQAIRIFQAGELLGEMAIIDQKPRSTSARAEAETTILTLSKDNFHHLLQESQETTLAVMTGLNDRIRYTTEFLGEVSGWVQHIAAGNYQARAAIQSEKFEDQTLASLAQGFARMAAQVQEREETLRREMALLRIEIDDAKRKQDADRIMQSDYYRALKEKAKLMRQQKQDDE